MPHFVLAIDRHRPAPDTLALLDACVTTHVSSLSLSDMQRYVTWCLAVGHRCPSIVLEAASARLLQRLLTHPVRPPPQSSPPCFVAQQARWLHAQQVQGMRPSVRHADAAYPTRVSFWDPEGTSYMAPAFEGVAARLLWGLACHWAMPSGYCTQVRLCETPTCCDCVTWLHPGDAAPDAVHGSLLHAAAGGALDERLPDDGPGGAAGGGGGWRPTRCPPPRGPREAACWRRRCRSCGSWGTARRGRAWHGCCTCCCPRCGCVCWGVEASS